jgi:hypothetical protein
MMPIARPSPVPAQAVLPREDTASRTVPFDYSFRFRLQRIPQSVQRTTVTVGIGASFTAVSIGYGVVPEVTPVIFGPQLAAGRPQLTLRTISLGDLLATLESTLANAPDAPVDMPALEATLRNGIKLNPDFAALALQRNGNAPLDASLLGNLFQVVSPPAGEVQFLYALFDEGSGREFQSDPLLNIAGLGASDGKRPFRYFAQPITFAPRSTIRMEITQLTAFCGELHVSLHGYKVIGPAGAAPPPRDRPPRRRGR